MLDDPTSLIHCRPIPGTAKLLGIVSGHHVHQQGKLVELDPTKGMEGDAGLTFIAGSDYEEKGVIVRSHYNTHPLMRKPGFPHSLDAEVSTFDLDGFPAWARQVSFREFPGLGHEASRAYADPELQRFLFR